MSSNKVTENIDWMEELELVRNLKKGDDEAFRVLVERYQTSILNTCYRFTNNKELSEDLTQEVFLEIYESIERFRGESRLSTWIYRIAVTKSLDYLKSMKRKKRFAVLQSLFGGNEMQDTIPAPDSSSPYKQLENQERITLLLRALDTLPANQRIAFTLSKYDAMSYQEIAGILDTSIPSVESLIHRAKRNLRKTLYTYYKKPS